MKVAIRHLLADDIRYKRLRLLLGVVEVVTLHAVTVAMQPFVVANVEEEAGHDTVPEEPGHTHPYRDRP